jgi:hypothetical protein
MNDTAQTGVAYNCLRGGVILGCGETVTAIGDEAPSVEERAVARSSNEIIPRLRVPGLIASRGRVDGQLGRHVLAPSVVNSAPSDAGITHWASGMARSIPSPSFLLKSVRKCGNELITRHSDLTSLGFGSAWLPTGGAVITPSDYD